MAFLRRVELSVGANGSGLLISELDVSFEVTRTVSLAANTAEFTVYNAKESTRNKVLTKGNNIICRAGYEDEGIKTIFIGNITEARSTKSGPDWVTEVKAASIRAIKDILEYTVISSSYSAGTRISRVIEDVANAANLVVSGTANASFTLLNGWVYAGSFRGAMDYLKKVLNPRKLGIYVDNDEMVIYKLNNKDSKFGSTYLTYTSGLISVESKGENEDGKKPVSITSILIPTMQPNGLVTVKTDQVSGTYIIEKVVHKGNNFGGDFVSEVEAIV